MKKSLMIGALAGVLLLPAASIELKQITLGHPQTNNLTAEITGSNVSTQPDHATFAVWVPAISGPSVALAGDCDKSNGNNPGIVVQCFLRWLMEVTDASTGF